MKTNRIAIAVALVLFAGVALAQSSLVNIDFAPRGMQGGFWSGPTGIKAAANKVTNVLAGSAVIDFASSTITCSDGATMTVTGALPGDPCFVGVPAAITANATFMCFVSAADTVRVRFCPAGTAADPASGTFNVRLISNQ